MHTSTAQRLGERSVCVLVLVHVGDAQRVVGVDRAGRAHVDHGGLADEIVGRNALDCHPALVEVRGRVQVRARVLADRHDAREGASVRVGL